MSAPFLGEFTPGKTVRRRFNTHKADGTPITLAGTPAISVYKGSTTESTSGVTLTVDYDARTGLHDVVIDTSADGTFYAAGSDFDLVLTAGTVDTISVVGSVVGTFSLSNRAGLRPTAADRTLDVSATGEAGLDWANVGSPTTALSLSGTTVGTLTTYTGNTPQTGDAYARLGAPATTSISADIGAVKADTGGTSTTVAAIKAKTDQLTFTTSNRVDTTAVSVSDKTGYSLAATGLDAITVTAPSGVATTFPGMMVQLFRRFFRKSTLTATQLKTYADDGTTVVTTQTVSDDGTTQTQGTAS